MQSDENFSLISEYELNYIVPLNRNTTEINLNIIDYTSCFEYHNRAIMAHSEIKDVYQICVFCDEEQSVFEMTDYIKRIAKSNNTIKENKKFDPSKDAIRDVSVEVLSKKNEFGVIIIKKPLIDKSPQEIYEMYELRGETEQMFDTLRNACENDASYMHDDDFGFEAWTFIGHISLMVASRILTLLRNKKNVKGMVIIGNSRNTCKHPRNTSRKSMESF
ncbi:MAG: hypothetical protein LBU04_01765 [Christensenellaceae bacterium]|jgi:hypothetical protein|nr:hypothetical protein [Christensenellaceae bacterium]